MTFEPYTEALHRGRAADLQQDAVTAGLTRRARRARRLERAAELFDRLARRLEARAGASRAEARFGSGRVRAI